MTGPAVAGDRHELAALLAGVRSAGGRVALVPTMGALHAGHASLVRLARERVGADGRVVASVFVNPLQFGPGEDLARYPRTFAADLQVCEREGADVVYAPDVADVYPGGEPEVTVAPGPYGELWEGAVRPGHFRGVLTVVAKLFGLVRPDVAVFGEKDYQQLVLVTRMVEDLCLGVEVVAGGTRREPDGLALSSRNRYLDADGRSRAAVLPQALRAGADAGPLGAEAVLATVRDRLAAAPDVAVDYVALTRPDLGPLDEPGPGGTPARLLAAVRLGSTRLLDNVAVQVGGPQFE